MQVEQKYLVFNIDQTKSFSPDGVESRIICAYASTWDVDLAQDRLIPGAFLNSIAKRFTAPLQAKGKSNIRFLFQHDAKEVIGTVKKIHEDTQGLYVECYISRTKRGDELLTLLKDGAIDKMSIGYIPIDFEEEGDIRVLKEVDIFEVSIVVFPMNEQTDIFEVRSLDISKLSKPKVLSTKQVLKPEATLLDFELKEFGYRAAQIHQEVKAGKVLSKTHKQKLLAALNQINEVLCAAAEPEPDADDKASTLSEMCSSCGEPMDQCKCAEMAAKESDSSKPLKEGVADPIRMTNPSNPQAGPGAKSTNVDQITKEDVSLETSTNKEEVSNSQNNTLDNTELTEFLKAFSDSVSRIK